MEIHLIKTTRKALILLFFMCLNCYSAFAQLEYENAIQRRDYQLAVGIMKVEIDHTEPNADMYYKRAVAYEGLGEYIYAISD